MSDSFSIVARHCAATLPDSISKRKELLEALSILIKRDHPAYEVLAAQLAAIETVERLQAELPLIFVMTAKPGDGKQTNS